MVLGWSNVLAMKIIKVGFLEVLKTAYTAHYHHT